MKNTAEGLNSLRTKKAGERQRNKCDSKGKMEPDQVKERSLKEGKIKDVETLEVN